MTQIMPVTEDPKRPHTPSRLWKIVRWIPLITMLLTLALLAILFLAGGLQKITAWYLSQLVLPALGLIVLLAIIVYILIKRRFGKLLLITSLSALLFLSPAILLVMPVAYPASLTSTTPAATVRLPTNVPLQVFWGGDTLGTNYHATTPDQRWAYDLGVAPYLGGSATLQEYGCYGIPVVAPVGGPVITAHDGEPDETPGILSNNVQAPTGNHVVIQLETGTYLVIAHLKQGSVLVRENETVQEGQIIGQCGNSGNTSEPHIHIHHQRENPALYPVGFAEGLPLYFRDHDGAPMPQGGVKFENNEPVLTGDTVKHIGQ